MSRYLLVSRVGRKSLHANWLASDADRKFDVYLSCYDPQLPEVTGDGVQFERRPGRKVAGYDGFLTEREGIWQKYDYICLMDEDIDASVDHLNCMFEICEANDLKIAQPSLTQNSHFTYAGLLQQPRWTLRYVNFIEMMCPVFRRDILERVRPLFSMGFESGIDLIWCNLVVETERDFAVIDSAPVRHTEPVGLNKSLNGFVGGKSYEDDIYAILQRFDLPWFSCAPFAGLEASGDEVSSRWSLAVSSLSLVPAIWRQHSWRQRARAVSDHLRHIVRARPGYAKIDIETSRAAR